MDSASAYLLNLLGMMMMMMMCVHAQKLKLWQAVSGEPSPDSLAEGTMTYEHFLEYHLRMPRMERKKHKHVFTETSQVTTAVFGGD